MEPITPVDITSACSARAPTASAAHAAICRASAIPCSPVHAFATPELIATTRIDSLGVRSRLTVTGAAHTRFLVYTPAATAGRSDTTSVKSSLRLRFTPQQTPAARKPCGSRTDIRREQGFGAGGWGT